MSQLIYYNYFYIDPRKPGHYTYGGLPMSFLFEPFYVGKGKHDRYRSFANRNKYFLNQVNKLITEGLPLEDQVFCFNHNTSEQDALTQETLYIRTIKRADLGEGPLLNYTDGGDGVKNYIFTDAAKAKMKAKRQGRQPSLGMKHTDETKAKLRAALNNRPKTEETKQKMRDNHSHNKPFLNKSHSAATKQKMSIALKKLASERIRIPSDNPMFGKHHSEASRNLMSQKAKQRPRKSKFVWTRIDPNGIIWTTYKLTNFCHEHNLQRSSMTLVSQGKQYNHKGWQCTKAPICPNPLQAESQCLGQTVEFHHQKTLDTSPSDTYPCNFPHPEASVDVLRK
jgi:hypothetical protein